MKKYIAIGHFRNYTNITCIVSNVHTRKEFEQDLKGNAFIAYMIISERWFNKYKEADVFGKLGMIPMQNRHSIEVYDYLTECRNVIEDKLMLI